MSFSFSPSQRQTLPVFAMLLVLSMTMACGGPHVRQIRGEAPAIELDSLTRLNDRIEVTVGIRNLNDSPVEYSAIRILLTLEEQGSVELVESHLDLAIGARGREIIQLTGRGDQDLQDSLEQLTSGQRTNLPWSMTVELGRGDRSDRETEASGFLHNVPGQANRFR